MREKIRKYSDIENDKSLINRIPNQSDLEKFEEWKKNYRKRMLNSSIFLGSIVGVLSVVFVAGGLFSEAELSGKVFLLLFFALFVYIVISRIKGYFNSKNLEMEYCNYGKVIDKYTKRKSQDTHEYYIIVEVDEKLFKFKSKQQYRLLEIGDDVTVFSAVGKDKVAVMKN